MADELGPDPVAPWLRDIAKAHDAARHADGARCRGSVALIDEPARLRGVAQVTLGRAISLEREVETRPDRLAERLEAAEAEKREWRRLGMAELADGHHGVDLEVQVGIHGRTDEDTIVNGPSTASPPAACCSMSRRHAAWTARRRPNGDSPVNGRDHQPAPSVLMSSPYRDDDGSPC